MRFTTHGFPSLASNRILLRRVIDNVKSQNWLAVFLDFVIVVVGVFIGIQVSNWNDALEDNERKQLIVEALVADLEDVVMVLEREFVAKIDAGLAEWDSAFRRGDRPPPFYLRIGGSDTPPETFSALGGSQLTELFDAITFFDLGLFYSELRGFGQRYVRYVTFVENEVLPGMKDDAAHFYRQDDSALLPEFEANMDRLSELRTEAQRLIDWMGCLITRLEADRVFEQNCLRSGFSLE